MPEKKSPEHDPISEGIDPRSREEQNKEFTEQSLKYYREPGYRYDSTPQGDDTIRDPEGKIVVYDNYEKRNRANEKNEKVLKRHLLLEGLDEENTIIRNYFEILFIIQEYRAQSANFKIRYMPATGEVQKIEIINLQDGKIVQTIQDLSIMWVVNAMLDLELDPFYPENVVEFFKESFSN